MKKKYTCTYTHICMYILYQLNHITLLQGTYTGLLFEQIKNSQEQAIEPEIQQIDSGLVGKLNAGYSYEVKMLHTADHKIFCLYVCVQKRY